MQVEIIPRAKFRWEGYGLDLRVFSVEMTVKTIGIERITEGEIVE